MSANRDALDLMMALAEPAEEQDRVELEAGISFWRSAGVVPAAGLRYQALLPAGLHVSAGRGELQSVIDGQAIRFSGAQYALFRLPRETDCTTALIPRSRWRSMGLWIAPDSNVQALLNKRAPCLPQPIMPDAGIGALIASTAHQRYRGVARDYALRAQGYALLATAFAAEMLPATPDTRRRDAVDAALAIIDIEYADPPSLADLARRVGSNRRYLTADFRARTGASIAAYITARRLEHARDILAAGLGPAQVAARVGLTPSHFAQAYRRRFGEPPSRHQRKFP